MKVTSSSLRRWACAWVAVGLGLFAAELRALEPKSQWVRARTEYVEVFSDASQREATEYALQYAAFRHVFTEMMGEPARKLPPTVIVLFRNRRTFDTYFPKTDDKGGELVTISCIADGLPVQAHVLNNERERTLRMAFEFEATWAMSRLSLGLPVWAAQGTGKVFSTVRMSRGVATVGDYPNSALSSWTNDMVPWPRFFDINQASKEYSDRERMSSYHSQVWAVMHYLWLQDERGTERFYDLVQRVRKEPEMAAALGALGLREAELTKTLSRYAGRANKTRQFKVDEAAWRAQMQTGAAERSVVGVYVADLLRSFRRPGTAELELAQAFLAAPENPIVLEGRAREALARNDREGALALYRDAMERKSTNVTAYLTSADNWLDQGRSGGLDHAGGGGIIAATAQAEIQRALEIDPRNEEAYRLLARALFVRPEIAPADLALLDPGLQLGDTKGFIRYYRALVLKRLKQDAEYEETLAALSVSTTAHANIREQAVNRLGKEVYNGLVARVEKLGAQGKFDEARALAAAARKGPLRAETFQSRLDNVDKWIAATEQQRAGK